MILKVPEHFDYIVYDSRGKELRYCTWCDTETGEAVHYKWPVRDTIDHTGRISFATEWRYHKAPLTYERITKYK
jgi:hypothetical protein